MIRLKTVARRLPLLVAVLAGIAFLSTCCNGPTPATLDGAWAGILNDTYYCEGGASTIELNISELTLTITGGFTAGLHRVFSYPPKLDAQPRPVVFAGGQARELYPQWWGAEEAEDKYY